MQGHHRCHACLADPADSCRAVCWMDRFSWQVPDRQLGMDCSYLHGVLGLGSDCDRTQLQHIPHVSS